MHGRLHHAAARSWSRTWTHGGKARWPVYAAAAHDEGVRAAFAFPLQIGAARLGVLDLYRDVPGSLTAEELAQALTFADVATSMLLDGQEEAPPGAAASGLAEVAGVPVELYQAQGMVMVQLGVTLVEALAVLRAYAYSHDRRPRRRGARRGEPEGFDSTKTEATMPDDGRCGPLRPGGPHVRCLH